MTTQNNNNDNANASQTASAANPNATATPTSNNNNNFFSSFSSNVNNLTTSFTTNLSHNINSPSSTLNTSLNNFSPLVSSIGNTLGLKNTLPDKTTASQVLMFRQLLHTSCRPGLRLSRAYQGTPAQKAVMHMPWWERGIESSGKMVISYDNLITRLWISGAILPFERGGYAVEEEEEGGAGDATTTTTTSNNETKPIDTMVNEKGLPPIPHPYWVDRLGFQQDDPVTDFRSGGVLSLAMLVHIAESCPLVHARFVPKPGRSSAHAPGEGALDNTNNNNDNNIPTELEEIIQADASVLPFGICSINVTDMLAKFLMFSKSVDKMDALLSSKPFWKMFMDSPNAMLVLQEVSLDLLCDVVVEIGRERRMSYLVELANNNNNNKTANNSSNNKSKNDQSKKKVGMHNNKHGRVTVFDFAEIMERTEKRVESEVLGAGPRNVDELRAVARRVKSKYLMRIQAKENHLMKSEKANALPSMAAMGTALPSKESMRNVTSSVIGGVGGFVNMWKPRGGSVADGTTTAVAAAATLASAQINHPTSPTPNNNESSYSEPKTPENPFASSSLPSPLETTTEVSAVAEAFDLLGGDLSPTLGIGIAGDDLDHSDVDILDALDQKLDPAAAFTIDDDDF